MFGCSYGCEFAFRFGGERWFLCVWVSELLTALCLNVRVVWIDVIGVSGLFMIYGGVCCVDCAPIVSVDGFDLVAVRWLCGAVG